MSTILQLDRRAPVCWLASRNRRPSNAVLHAARMHTAVVLAPARVHACPNSQYDTIHIWGDRVIRCIHQNVRLPLDEHHDAAAAAAAAVTACPHVNAPNHRACTCARVHQTPARRSAPVREKLSPSARSPGKRKQRIGTARICTRFVFRQSHTRGGPIRGDASADHTNRTGRVGAHHTNTPAAAAAGFDARK